MKGLAIKILVSALFIVLSVLCVALWKYTTQYKDYQNEDCKGRRKYSTKAHAITLFWTGIPNCLLIPLIALGRHPMYSLRPRLFFDVDSIGLYLVQWWAILIFIDFVVFLFFRRGGKDIVINKRGIRLNGCGRVNGRKCKKVKLAWSDVATVEIGKTGAQSFLTTTDGRKVRFSTTKMLPVRGLFFKGFNHKEIWQRVAAYHKKYSK